mgnify:CR=1 FL=1
MSYSTEKKEGLPSLQELHSYFFQQGIIIIYEDEVSFLEAIGTHLLQQELEPSPELDRLLNKFMAIK